MLVTDRDENLLFLRDLLILTKFVTWRTKTNQRSWKNESTDSAPDTKSTEQSDKNIKRCRYYRKGKGKVSLKDRQCIQKKVERKSWPELVITKVRGAKAYTKRLHVWLRILSEQMGKRGERETRVARVAERFFFHFALLPSLVTRTSRSPRLRLCWPKIRNKSKLVLQATAFRPTTITSVLICYSFFLDGMICFDLAIIF